MLRIHKSWKIAALVGMLSLIAMPLAASAADDHEGAKTMTAEIVEVDVDTNRLMLKPMDAEINEIDQSDEYEAEKKGLDKGQIAVVVDDDTRIRNDAGHLVALPSLRTGEFVNVRYHVNDGELIILGIVIRETTG